ncbi:MAG: NFACT family protein [Methanobacteriota archaeon]|nr:MAG: NFACT family protein [Euryarchaeota archaeon]
MKRALSSFDVRALVRELQKYVGWRVDKIYQPDGRHLVVSVKASGEGKEFLHFVLGEWLYASETAIDMPQRPSDFAMMLRKRIANSRIVMIEQKGFDRIVVITLEKDERYQLVFEIFGKGNVILVKEGLIVQPLISRKWRHREVKAKREFKFPPPVFDPSSMSADDLLEILRTSDSDIVRTLATKLNLGGRYGEETCERAQVECDKPAAEISLEEARSLLEGVKTIIGDILNELVGYIVERDGEPVDAVPLRMAIYDGYQHEKFETFSECIGQYITRIPKPQGRDDTDGFQADLDRLKRKLAQQEDAALRLRREGAEARAVGDSIFASYGDFVDTLQRANDLLARSDSLENIPGFISFDRKSAILRVVIGDGTYDLDVNGTVETNAQRYYERSKKLKTKLEGVLPALEETRTAIAEWSRKRRGAEKGRSTSLTESAKRFWFERYRWFISSEGAIVLGGKDAKTNDTLVKKHLQLGDRYVHADIHGAPSVVVKMKEGVGEQTLMEACEFAIATSKAWTAEMGSGVGYWVMPEQVSKTPQSGEFLARGAFVIRGKRNYSNKTEIRLGVGVTEFEGEKKMMCGPVDAVKARCTSYVLIRPGAIDKNEFAKAVAKAFRVSIEDVQRILPPGNVDIEKTVGTELELGAT